MDQLAAKITQDPGDEKLQKKYEQLKRVRDKLMEIGKALLGASSPPPPSPIPSPGVDEPPKPPQKESIRPEMLDSKGRIKTKKPLSDRIVLDDEDLEKNFPGNPEAQQRIREAAEIFNSFGALFTKKGDPIRSLGKEWQFKSPEEILSLEDPENPIRAVFGNKENNEITPKDVEEFHKKVLLRNDFTDEEIVYLYSHFPTRARNALNAGGTPNRKNGIYNGTEEPDKSISTKNEIRGLAALKRYLEQGGRDAYTGLPISIFDCDWEHIVPNNSEADLEWASVPGRLNSKLSKAFGPDHPDNMVMVRGGLNRNRGDSPYAEFIETSPAQKKRPEETEEEWKKRINSPFEQEIARIAAEITSNNDMAKSYIESRIEDYRGEANFPSYDEAVKKLAADLKSQGIVIKKSDLKKYLSRNLYDSDRVLVGKPDDPDGKLDDLELTDEEREGVPGFSLDSPMLRQNGRGGSAPFPGAIKKKLDQMAYGGEISSYRGRVIAQRILDEQRNFFRFSGNTSLTVKEYLKRQIKHMRDLGLDDKEILAATKALTSTFLRTSDTQSSLPDRDLAPVVYDDRVQGIPRPEPAQMNKKKKTKAETKVIKDWINAYANEILAEV
jgi:hypothetical protein